MAEAHPEIIIPSYQDNLVIVGRLSKVLSAHLMLKHELKNLGLRLNPSESEVYIPAWVEAKQTSMQVCPHFRRIPAHGRFFPLFRLFVFRLLKKNQNINPKPLF